MWTLGKLQIEGRVVLGPMAGVTSMAYRLFMKPFGVALSYTEMVSDCGLIYENETTIKYTSLSPDEHPVGIQLFGAQEATIVQAVQIIENLGLKHDFIDLNLGCPMPKVTRSGAGSAWLKKIDELERMVRAVVQISHTPVTAKIRLGWDQEHINYEAVIKALERAGIAMICLHARTTSQVYSGKARYDLLQDLRQRMTVPLVISGDIFTAEDAVAALQITQADAVMVARGSLGKPRLISQINALLKGETPLPDATLQEQITYLGNFAELLIRLKGESLAIRELRGIGTHFLNGYPGMKPYKVKMCTMETRQDLEAILRDISQGISLPKGTGINYNE